MFIYLFFTSYASCVDRFLSFTTAAFLHHVQERTVHSFFFYNKMSQGLNLKLKVLHIDYVAHDVKLSRAPHITL